MDLLSLKSTVQFSIIVCLWEAGYRMKYSNSSYTTEGVVFTVSYLLCVFSSTFRNLELPLFKDQNFKSFISFLHGLDGLSALIIGISIHYNSALGLCIGNIMITKIFLLFLLNRMILTNKTDGSLLADIIQTSKSYIHHVASFLFLHSSSPALLYTTIWRTISLSGHATLVLRGKYPKTFISKLDWFFAYGRMSIVVIILLLCLFDVNIRQSFGDSAVGHIAYMVVRIGPVFRLGSIYLNEHDKSIWVTMTDTQKIYLLLQGKHPWLTLELLLLLVTSVVFTCLRLKILVEDIMVAKKGVLHDISIIFNSFMKSVTL